MRLSSHSQSSGGSVLNDVTRTFNAWGQLVAEQQSHSGGVNFHTPTIGYGYASGSGGTVRPTSLTYPDGRTVSFGYGAAGSADDAAGRVASISDGATTLASYRYLGTGTVVEVDLPEPDLRYALVGTAGGTNPESGDIYHGLDRFGRVTDAYWGNYGSGTDAARLQYGYDRSGNRIYRRDAVATSLGKDFDEFYSHDGLDRLAEQGRGRLNPAGTGLTATTFRQTWNLDATGNWSAFREDTDGDGAWNLNQTRTANRANELTAITETAGPAWATPVYDAAGNMTTLPQPADPTAAYTAVYDAWNRLVRLSDANGPVQENAYDARGFRVIRKTYAAGSLSETRHFYYTDRWQCLEERVGSPLTAAADRQYVWGVRYIDDLVCRQADGQRLYALQDANWNIEAVADAAGNVRERYAYSAYGERRVLDGGFASRAASGYG